MDAVRTHGMTPHEEVLVRLARILARMGLAEGPRSFLGCTIARYQEDLRIAMARACLSFLCMRRAWYALRERKMQPAHRPQCNRQVLRDDFPSGVLVCVCKLPSLLHSMPSFCLGVSRVQLEDSEDELPHAVASRASGEHSDSDLSSGDCPDDVHSTSIQISPSIQLRTEQRNLQTRYPCSLNCKVRFPQELDWLLLG